MKPTLLTLDCAETLLGVRWTPGGFAVDAARECGLEPSESADGAYHALFGQRYSRFREVNLQPEAGPRRAFWLELTQAWLFEIGLPVERAPDLLLAADSMLHETPERHFPAFVDTRPALEALRELGVRMAVVSNWDYSLGGILRAHRMDHFFEGIYASMEVGYEKPDPRFFNHVLNLHRVEPEAVLHVGDNPVDDLLGARNAGLKSVLLDRSEGRSASSLGTLLDLVDRCR